MVFELTASYFVTTIIKNLNLIEHFCTLFKYLLSSFVNPLVPGSFFVVFRDIAQIGCFRLPTHSRDGYRIFFFEDAFLN